MIAKKTKFASKFVKSKSKMIILLTFPNLSLNPSYNWYDDNIFVWNNKTILRKTVRRLFWWWKFLGPNFKAWRKRWVRNYTFFTCVISLKHDLLYQIVLGPIKRLKIFAERCTSKHFHMFVMNAIKNLVWWLKVIFFKIMHVIIGKWLSHNQLLHFGSI